MRPEPLLSNLQRLWLTHQLGGIHSIRAHSLCRNVSSGLLQSRAKRLSRCSKNALQFTGPHIPRNGASGATKRHISPDSMQRYHRSSSPEIRSMLGFVIGMCSTASRSTCTDSQTQKRLYSPGESNPSIISQLQAFMAFLSTKSRP